MSEQLLNFGRVASACGENAASIGAALDACFGRSGDVTPGEVREWNVPPEGLFAPGVLVRIGNSTSGLLGMIPAALPLPDWRTVPSTEAKSRLANLACDWAKLLLPADAVADIIEAEFVADLAAAAAAAEPSNSAQLLPLHTGAIVGAEAGDARSTIYLLGPVSKLKARPEASISTAGGARNTSPASPRTASPAVNRISRLGNLPVEVVVRLAERKIELGQLLSLAPGALLTFEKNCEDLLDLYVNNRLYCRGEAVKIGEHFGLKVNEVGAVKCREERVF